MSEETVMNQKLQDNKWKIIFWSIIFILFLLMVLASQVVSNGS